MTRIAWMAVLVVAGGACATAAEEHMKIPAAKPSATFERIKALEGTWRGSTQHGSMTPEPAEARYDVTSGGSAVIETLFPGTPHEMVSVYHEQGGTLTMTHYCMLGNRPLLELTGADAKQVSLSLAGQQGLGSAEEPHMHALSIAWESQNEITQRWTSYDAGQPQETTTIKLTRVQ